MFGENYECAGGVSAEALLSDLTASLSSLPVHETTAQLLMLGIVGALLFVNPRPAGRPGRGDCG